MEPTSDGGRAPHTQAADDEAMKKPPLKAPAVPDPRQCELSRLFIVCGRGRKLDELQTLFSAFGAIKHLHLALDRSKKSRGFAFLQYEDPANAAVAIEKLDHMKLDDGHILKVTIAKEKPVGGNGKLKRDQHARQDMDGKVDGTGRDDDGGNDVRVPGKRQRSSPPVAAMPFGPRCISPVFQLHPKVPSGFTTTGFFKNEVPVISPPSTGNGILMTTGVHEVLRAMVNAVEKQEAQKDPNNDLFATYQREIARNADEIHHPHGGLKVLVSGATKIEDENSTESLASSIRSVSLTSTPLATHSSPLNVLGTSRPAVRESGGLIPARFGKLHLRRRRQSLDGSSSSGSDSSGVRRKRSNTTSSPPALKSGAAGNHQAWSPSRKLSDRSDISLSPDALKAEIIAKKQCKRQSSDNTIEESHRAAKQRATRGKDNRNANELSEVPIRHSILNAGSKENTEIKLECKSEALRARLFFTSTYKFTEQELEAMFAVYGDFESVELVKSFGRVKTMAYVCYSKPLTAAFVVKSFREESSQGEEDPEKAEFMALSFAHESGRAHSTPPQRVELANIHSEPRPKGLTLTPTSASAFVSTSGTDRLWVLLLYDRYLATHMLSSVVSSFTGMEFMDIKVVKSTGEAQGVAFVKFDSEENATEAALQLHQMELPLGSGKFLQAIVILAPSLFTATHGNNAITNNDSLRLDRASGDRVVTGSLEDVDLRAVEARFAHLMRSSEHQHAREGYYFPQYSPNGGSTNDVELQISPMAANTLPPYLSTGLHSSMGMSTGMEYYPMQLLPYPSPQQQQQFQPYPTFGGSTNYPQMPQNQTFGASASGWMETSSYYQGGAPQYPFSCGPEQEMAFPVAPVSNGNDAMSSSDAYGPPKPRSSSEQMDVQDDSSSCSSQQTFTSIQVATNEPIELVSLVCTLQDYPGVMAFTKDGSAGIDRTRYLVDFANETQAIEAARNLDGSLCGGQRLRVERSTARKHCGGGGKARVGSGRRKRQRVDLRSRK